VDSIHLIHGGEVPESWLDLGFEWSKSYDQWISWLEDLGYTIEIDKKPSVKRWESYGSFHASVYARIERPQDMADFRCEQEHDGSGGLPY
jgi:hypothetical protein